jgi:hypothetical protein
MHRDRGRLTLERDSFGVPGLGGPPLMVSTLDREDVATRPTALDLFWRPVIQQTHSVMLCLGRSNFRAGDPSAASWHPTDPHQVAVAWWDAETLARMAGLVQSKGASLYFFREDQATFSDFQQRPAVLIGAYNDQWTLELMSRMRYRFRQNGKVQWIQDRDRPSFRDWKTIWDKQTAQGNLALKQDYAIISRVENPRTGFITVTVAGLWGYGTMAAGRFLTDPQFMQDFCKRTGFKLDKNNMQIVIGTEVIQGKPGPPTVLARIIREGVKERRPIVLQTCCLSSI